jgi:hypothetical protein
MDEQDDRGHELTESHEDWCGYDAATWACPRCGESSGLQPADEPVRGLLGTKLTCDEVIMKNIIE